MGTDADLTRRERAVVNAYQGGFPAVEHPFEPAAEAMRERGVDIEATALLETVRDLDERAFSPVRAARQRPGDRRRGDARRHARPDDEFDEVVERINAHREVAHNYEREHPT